MQAVIEVSGLGKQYQLGVLGISTLREEVSEWWQHVKHIKSRSKLQSRRTKRYSERTMWALREVCFKVEPGDVIGIMGLNGAGKSTLLKLLSRITEPTEGEILIRGRLASLLEVGTGFHPDLTGRENIFLNGAILGMQRSEIAEKFDHIVEFAEVGRFVDTPVKRYSSGMYVRLAFSVAAHLEPEIMIVDEVLAVGDFAFQAKCIERMRKLTISGKTILLVSHNLYTLQTLCKTGILLRDGRLALQDSMHRVIAEFRRMSLEETNQRLRQTILEGAKDVFVETISMNGVSRRVIEADGDIELNIVCNLQVRTKRILHFGFSVKSSDGVYISGLSTFVESKPRLYDTGMHVVGIRFKRLSLSSGSYKVAFAVMNEDGVATYFADDSVGELLVVRHFHFDGSIGLEHEWFRSSANNDRAETGKTFCSFGMS